MIREPYVLFTRITLVKTKSNRIFCNSLWAKDLKLHLQYIDNFQLCCPLVYGNEPEGNEFTEITDYDIKQIFALREDYGIKSVTKNIIFNFQIVIQACKNASIVHSGGAGWAFSLSFYLLFLRFFFSFKWIMVIESSFWMMEKGESKNLRKFVNHYLHKILLSLCVKKADARIFTQSFYKRYFLRDVEDRVMINPATWIDQDKLISRQLIKDKFASKKSEPLKIIFPARLIKEKGVFIVFEAIRNLQDMDCEIQITIMGSGDLEQQCHDFALNDFGKVKVDYQKFVEYGYAFFKMLRNYDVVLVANLRQEQPRIIFDAFSQGLGVIAADTSGILDITNSSNSIIFKRGDANSLADSISYLAKNPQLIETMAINGHRYVQNKTHSQMHLEREHFLQQALELEKTL